MTSQAVITLSLAIAGVTTRAQELGFVPAVLIFLGLVFGAALVVKEAF